MEGEISAENRIIRVDAATLEQHRGNVRRFTGLKRCKLLTIRADMSLGDVLRMQRVSQRCRAIYRPRREELMLPRELAPVWFRGSLHSTRHSIVHHQSTSLRNDYMITICFVAGFRNSDELVFQQWQCHVIDINDRSVLF